MSKQACKRLRRALRLDVSRAPMPAHADWGYPLFYVTSDGGALCAACVNREMDIIDPATRDPRDRSGWRVVAVDVHWEGEPIGCDHCGGDIESAYGPVDPGEPDDAIAQCP